MNSWKLLLVRIFISFSLVGVGLGISQSENSVVACTYAEWNGTTRYWPGDRVMRKSVAYEATQLSATTWNVNTPPEWSPNYWFIVTCSEPVPAPAPAPAPAPEPTPAPAPVTGSEPAQVLAVYFEAYKWGGIKITDVPPEFNVIYLFNARPDGTDGTFVWTEGEYPWSKVPNPQPGTGNPAVAPKLIQEVRARGQLVVLTVGGAGLGFNFDTRAKSEKFVASFKRMATYLGGVDGVDFNNFESQVGSSSTEMVWIAQTLRNHYGPGFLITAPPSGAVDWGWIDTNIGRALNKAGLLSWFGPQIYDDPNRYSSAEKIAFEVNRWISPAPDSYVATGFNNQYGLGDASKIIVGFPASWMETSSGYPLLRATDAYDLIKAKHPTLRGVFAWNAHSNFAGGNVFGKMFASKLAMAPAPTPPPPVEPTPVEPPPPVVSPPTHCIFELWSPRKMYHPGAMVSLNGIAYLAEKRNKNSRPDISAGFWVRHFCG